MIKWIKGAAFDIYCGNIQCNAIIPAGTPFIQHYSNAKPDCGKWCYKCGITHGKATPFPSGWVNPIDKIETPALVADDFNAKDGLPFKSQCPSCGKLYTYPPTGFVCEVSRSSCGWLGQSHRPELVAIHIPEGEARAITIMSFSYKYGVPDPKPDRIIDGGLMVRNPWRDPQLRKLNGLDTRVQEFVQNCRGTKKVLLAAKGLYKSNQTIAIGCMGGKHRSVALAELVGREYREKGWDVTLIHRDLDRKGKVVDNGDSLITEGCEVDLS